MPEGREYELKFEIGSENVHELLSNPSVTSLETRSRLRSTYFDTADGALQRRGISLRVRRCGASVVQTVKRAGSSIIDREEWEREDAGTTPDLVWLRTTPLKRLFSKTRVARDLQPRFTVDVERSVFILAREDAEIEGALDRGTIETTAGSLPISEFELELKTGDRKAILTLARDLARDVPMVLSLASKSERGFGRVDPAWGRPTKVLQLQLRRGMNLVEAFEATIQAALKLLLANTALIGFGDDADAVHKARIALRRLRAAIELFEPILRRRWRRTILVEVKWMSKVLGEARDTDVFLEQVQKTVGDGDGRQLIGVMRDHQRAVRDHLQRALSAPRWRLLLLDLVDVSQHGLRRKAKKRPLRPFLDAQLAWRRRSLVKRSRGLGALPPEARHDVRKRAKMLRYTCDFAKLGAGLVSHKKAVRRLTKDLQVLQETLGALQDGEALRDRLRKDVLDSDKASGLVEAAARRIVEQEPPSRRTLRKAREALRSMRRL